MLTCIARQKQGSGESQSVDHRNQPSEKHNSNDVPTKQAIKSLSSQVFQSLDINVRLILVSYSENGV